MTSTLTPTPEQLRVALSTARTALNKERAVIEALRTYYDPERKFAGATFLDLPNDPSNIDSTDLYALSTLDVSASPLAGRRLLYPGPHGICQGG